MLAATPDTGTLLLELGAILVGLTVLGRFAARVGIPAIPLYLVAGLLVGEGGIAELLTARTFIEAGAEIGVILLLLLLGLEYSGRELMDALRQNGASGAIPSRPHLLHSTTTYLPVTEGTPAQADSAGPQYHRSTCRPGVTSNR